MASSINFICQEVFPTQVWTSILSESWKKMKGIDFRQEKTDE